MTIMIPAWVDGKLVPVEKLAAHERALRHMAVSVFVKCRGEVLLQQRALGKYHTPGLWANTCCTHPHWGEAADVCAHRRLEEELGITGLTLESRGQVEYRADVGNGLVEHEVVEVFVATCETRVDVAANPEEVMAYRWHSMETLSSDVANNPEAYTPWLQIYLRDHAAMIFS